MTIAKILTIFVLIIQTMLVIIAIGLEVFIIVTIIDFFPEDVLPICGILLLNSVVVFLAGYALFLRFKETQQ